MTDSLQNRLEEFLKTPIAHPPRTNIGQLYKAEKLLRDSLAALRSLEQAPKRIWVKPSRFMDADSLVEYVRADLAPPENTSD